MTATLIWVTVQNSLGTTDLSELVKAWKKQQNFMFFVTDKFGIFLD